MFVCLFTYECVCMFVSICQPGNVMLCPRSCSQLQRMLSDTSSLVVYVYVCVRACACVCVCVCVCMYILSAAADGPSALGCCRVDL